MDLTYLPEIQQKKLYEIKHQEIVTMEVPKDSAKHLKLQKKFNKKRKPQNQEERTILQKRKKVTEQNHYRPTGLTPILSSKAIEIAMTKAQGYTIKTGWLTITEIGEIEKFQNSEYVNITVESDKITRNEENKIRIKVGPPIPRSFPVDAFQVGNRIRSNRCKIYNKGKGYATISIIDATFVIDTADPNYRKHTEDNDDDNDEHAAV